MNNYLNNAFNEKRKERLYYGVKPEHYSLYDHVFWGEAWRVEERHLEE